MGHVVLSVGWAGAVAVFLALALTGLMGADPQIARAAYVAMKTATDCVIIPLSAAAPITGLALALGTRWRLVRHYWILIKAVMTLPATALLFLHTGPINRLAEAAMAGALPPAARSAQLQMAVDSGLALVVLLVAAALGVIKPAGETGLGRKS
jgi:hypothetical protein